MPAPRRGQRQRPVYQCEQLPHWHQRLDAPRIPETNERGIHCIWGNHCDTVVSRFRTLKGNGCDELGTRLVRAPKFVDGGVLWVEAYGDDLKHESAVDI